MARFTTEFDSTEADAQPVWMDLFDDDSLCFRGFLSAIGEVGVHRLDYFKDGNQQMQRDAVILKLRARVKS